MDLGARIRLVRTDKNISIKELAEAVSVSPSMISQIERNLCNPSLPLLKHIAQSLELPLWGLLYEEELSTRVIRKDNRKIITVSDNGKMQQAYLTPNRNLLKDKNQGLEIIHNEWKKESSSGFFNHAGEEAIYVLEGSIEITIGEESYILEQDDCIYYEASVPHNVHVLSDVAKFLAIITPPSF